MESKYRLEGTIITNLNNRTIISIAFILAICLLTVTSVTTQRANALSGSDFNASRIIDDEIFYNNDSMTASQVQTFLNSKVPTCDTNGQKMYNSTQTRAQYGASRGYPAPYTCLKDYKQTTPQMEAASGLCGPLSAGTRTAAQIIKDVGDACGINPQTLIVLLQKEQSLITDDWPWKVQYDKATGFSCPDTAPCDPNYAGFFYQVYYAARQFKVYAKYPDNYSYKAGRNNRVYWHPDLNRCGSSTVFIQNQATASLYIYTPYRPNTAALNNLYGTGDSCSSYGNRNFWRMFNDWFGSTTAPLLHTRLFDATTDKSGERARIGVWLDKRPKANVTIPIYVYSPSTARIVGSHTSITITPDYFDYPEKNIITIAGKYNQSLDGNFENQIRFGKAISSDPYYNGANLGGSDRPFLHQNSQDDPDVYRLYKSGRHYFTANNDEKNARVADGWSGEGSPFAYCQAGDRVVARLTKDSNIRLAVVGSSQYEQAIQDGFVEDKLLFSASSQGVVPVYWLFNSSSGNSIYSTSPNEGSSSGYVNNGAVFTACDSNHNPVYRLYRPSAGNYFLTESPYERDRAVNELGYTYEGTGHYVCNNGTQNVYRLYNKVSRKHLYTTSQQERDKSLARNSGWHDDGVALKTCTNGTHPVYRLYKESIRKYLYTTSIAERDKAVSELNYINEGIIYTVR